MKSDSKKSLNLLNHKSDLPQIEDSIHSYLNHLDNLTGKGLNKHPAPGCMNRLLIDSLTHRITYLTAKQLAIHYRDEAKTKRHLASLVLSQLEKKLNELKVCDLQIPKYDTLYKWIVTDASETYTESKKT